MKTPSKISPEAREAKLAAQYSAKEIEEESRILQDPEHPLHAAMQVKRLLHERRISKSDLGRYLDVTPSAVVRMMAVPGRIIGRIPDIARFLNVEPETLLGKPTVPAESSPELPPPAPPAKVSALESALGKGIDEVRTHPVPTGWAIVRIYAGGGFDHWLCGPTGKRPQNGAQVVVTFRDGRQPENGAFWGSENNDDQFFLSPKGRAPQVIPREEVDEIRTMLAPIGTVKAV